MLTQEFMFLLTRILRYGRKATNRLVCSMKRKRSNKYEEILTAAMDLICKEGYKTASLQEIANRVGIHKTSLFHYIENKEDLLRRILKNSLGKVSLNLEEIVNNDKLTPDKKLREAFENHLRLAPNMITNQIVYSNDFPNLSKKTQKMFLEERRKYEKIFKKIVIELKRDNYLNGLDTGVVTLGLFGMLNWFPKWYRSDGRLRMEEISNIFCKMILGKGPR